jgi:hypothetical protein
VAGNALSAAISTEEDDRMFKLLIGAALGFAAGAWFMSSEEGPKRLELIKEKAAGITGRDTQASEGDSYASATAGEPIVESDPTSAPGPETFSRS